jgi:CheY-like chemotaxis protein
MPISHDRIPSSHPAAAAGEPAGGNASPSTGRPAVHVLVVDDERVVRRALQRILERDGNRVTLAECGEQALTTYHQGSGDFDVVILDVMMPDVDGREVLRRMREVDPGVRVILSSGFTAESDPSLNVEGTWLLQKPYTPDQVRSAIAQALAGPK